MADTMQFDLVSPERKLMSVQATSVVVPGYEGEFTAMPGHALFFSTLRPGFVQVMVDGKETDFFVTGGFAEVSADSVTILAETAVPRGEVTREHLDDLLAVAEDGVRKAGDHHRLSAAQRANDMRFARDQVVKD
ncbi:ATP synthase F1 subunit epsilon [Paroceanicella profunda]|uniref:ATP synthase epsilon chain n=1 Tax=Paroceanicella profunda TaxID=2579971 RepID=A0A5B8FHB3_9RHOB|nr:ATP synthase F1 subunit epsilon [Paroceanicella profunda]QDL91987.1 ATP synthase F1 subunit epsilon [Paroceanicella profunda]